MVCKNCGEEKFLIGRVYRNRKRVCGKWVKSDDTDTRLLICEKCGSRYYSQSSIVLELKFDKSTYRVNELNVNNYPSLFYD